MTLNVTIFICLFTTFILLYHGYEARSLKPQIIADMIKVDRNVCNATFTIQNSQYVQECNKTIFPEKFVNITKENLNQFLCLALYDRYVKICHYNDIVKEIKIENIPVLNNQVIFDTEIKKIIDKKDHDMWVVCGRLQKFSPVYSKTKLFVSQLESIFKKKTSCAVMCDNGSEIINPLCIVLKIIDDQIEGKFNNTNVEVELLITPTIITVTDQTINNSDKKNISQLDTHLKTTLSSGSNINKKKSEHKIEKITIPDKIYTTTKININENLKKNKLQLPKSKSNIPTTDPPDEKINIVTDYSIIEIKNSKDKNTPESNLPKSIRNGNLEEESPDYGLISTEADQLPDPDDDDDLKPLLKMNDLNDQENIVPRFSSIHEEGDSHFLDYFTVIGLIGIGGYLIYHHKQKILAMIVEGRRSRNGRGRKRPSTASYRKLDCNLEEAVTSQCNSNVTHVIY